MRSLAPASLRNCKNTPTFRGVPATVARSPLSAGTLPARYRSSRRKSWKGSSALLLLRRLPDIYRQPFAHARASNLFISLFWHRYLNDCLRVSLDHGLGLRLEYRLKQRPYLVLDLFVSDRSVYSFKLHLLLRHWLKLYIFAERKSNT